VLALRWRPRRLTPAQGAQRSGDRPQPGPPRAERARRVRRAASPPGSRRGSVGGAPRGGQRMQRARQSRRRAGAPGGGGPRTGRRLAAQPAAQEDEAPLPALRRVLLRPGVVPEQQVHPGAPQAQPSRNAPPGTNRRVLRTARDPGTGVCAQRCRSLAAAAEPQVDATGSEGRESNGDCTLPACSQPSALPTCACHPSVPPLTNLSTDNTPCRQPRRRHA